MVDSYAPPLYNRNVTWPVVPTRRPLYVHEIKYGSPTAHTDCALGSSTSSVDAVGPGVGIGVGTGVGTGDGRLVGTGLGRALGAGTGIGDGAGLGP